MGTNVLSSLTMWVTGGEDPPSSKISTVTEMRKKFLFFDKGEDGDRDRGRVAGTGSILPTLSRSVVILTSNCSSRNMTNYKLKV